jgi:hypothetical protein
MDGHGSNQWPFSSIISTEERFCHIIRNFVDDLQELMIFPMCWSHAFERAVNPKKLRAEGGISPLE